MSKLLQRFNRKSLFLPPFLVICFFLFTGSTAPVEGMFPLSEIAKLDLKEAGLKIEPSEIYNPDRVSLVDALVRVGGCTGSFVSAEGLILTNHHCAFDHVRKVSTVENNYLEEGFLADEKGNEIPAEGLTCKITIGYEDVSETILSAAEGKPFNERMQAIGAKMTELEQAAEAEDPNITAEVAEMFTGKSYVLFRYQTLRDVRIVYVPPRSIGEFGGERDNWEWPKHTGDFAFYRAYVAPNGSMTEYSPDNVPYQPKKHLTVNPDGVNDGDFVFMLGYPGRTYRHRPWQFIDFQEKVYLPYISGVFREMIDVYETMGEYDAEVALGVASKIKRLANVMKNFQGKMVGLKKMELVESKKAEETALQDYIEADAELNDIYGDLLPAIDAIYEERFETGSILYIPLALRYGTSTYGLANIVNARAGAFEGSDNVELLSTLEQIEGMKKTWFPEAEAAVISAAVLTTLEEKGADTFNAFQPFVSADDTEEAVRTFFKNAFASTILLDEERTAEALAEGLEPGDDPLLDFFAAFRDAMAPVDAAEDERQGRLNVLLGKLYEVKSEWKNEMFVPDANSTLRLSYGYIEGYVPADATWYSPITGLGGVIEKNLLDLPVYELPEEIVDLHEAADYGQYVAEDINDVPVCILYSTDTTGGNSGSPMLDAYGRLIGLNFDRTFQATINDYAWDHSYSRSIGVDVRYVLWVAEKFSGADNIISELGAGG